ncbi:MAG TPA: PLP-dependent transferase, partial [Sphingomicrobium sp.]|nr:PLP-dependent transferase [Sphingomicrobium sp.]
MAGGRREPPARATRLIRPGTKAPTDFDSLTVPTYRASTVLFADLDALDHPRPGQYRYGIHGTPTARELELRLAAIEEANSVALAPSG